MLFRHDIARAIAEGSVTLAFRRWRRPAATAGGRQRMPAGIVEFRAVDVVAEADIGEAEAAAAGFPSRAALVAALAGEGTLYRIRLAYAGNDSRAALRRTVAEEGEVAARLQRLDRASRHGPWTHRVLTLIDTRPGVRASELAAELGRAAPAFKNDVRRLKELGLTESLDVGYRLSPRGAAYLAGRT